MKTTKFGIVLLVLALFTSVISWPQVGHAQTYLIRSQSDVPFPYDPYEGAEPILTLDAGKQTYQVQDNTNDWNLLMAAKELDAMSAMDSDSLDPGGTNIDNGGGDFTNNYQPLVFGTNDLWIEITAVDPVSQIASLTLHGTVPDDRYQLLSTNLLNSDGEEWTLGEIILGTEGTNRTDFSTFNVGTNTQLFFRAHHADPEIAVSQGQPAIEPNPSTGDPGGAGYFTILSYYPLTNNLAVHYTIGGGAQNGVDYSNITDTVTLTPDYQSTNVYIVPIANPSSQATQTVTLTIQQTNSYLIDRYSSSATNFILASSTTVGVVIVNAADAIRPDGPPGEPASPGQFLFFRNDVRNLYPEMSVYYVVSGTASNGVDYTLLSGTVDFPDQFSDVYVDLNPLSNNMFNGIETVTVTLVPTNTYFINPDYTTSSLNVDDSSTYIGIQKTQDAIETNVTLRAGQEGTFRLFRGDVRGYLPPLTVNYVISGTASNGVDYQTLSDSITLADGQSETNIYVQTLPDDLIEGDETVNLTLIPSANAFLFYTGLSNATVTIHDTIGFFTVATNLNGPIGIDYYEPSNSLIVSYNYNGNGKPFVFAQIFTSIVLSGGVPVTNLVVTNWTGISNLQDEVYFATAKTGGALTNSAGFTNGDLLFGNDKIIGYISADGTRSNMNWSILSNTTTTNSDPFRGGFCIDQTGTFSNDLIAVPSFGGDSLDSKGIWLVDSHSNPRLLTQIHVGHLEGVTTLTNDTQKWGPWAGKIITGDENTLDFFTIDTNGIVTTNDTTALIAGGIAPEDFAVIPANSPLYVSAYNNNSIMELPPAYFTNYVGDLLVLEAGEVQSRGPGLYVIHWNSQGSNFITTRIPLPSTVGGHIEHVLFAPVQFPGY